MKRTIALVIASFLLSGCTTMENVQHGAPAALSANEAIAVVRMHQPFRIHLQRGQVSDDTWHAGTFSSPDANLFPVDGYIVVKLPAPKADERYSIPMVLPKGIGVTTPMYIPCSGSTAPAFGLEGGSVNYVGELSITAKDHMLAFEVSWDEEAAKSFLASHYPELLPLYRASPMVQMKIHGTNCNPTIYVPIYVPAG